MRRKRNGNDIVNDMGFISTIECTGFATLFHILVITAAGSCSGGRFRLCSCRSRPAACCLTATGSDSFKTLVTNRTIYYSLTGENFPAPTPLKATERMRFKHPKIDVSGAPVTVTSSHFMVDRESFTF